jgi:4-amino-4-deoxy-L-arabinose transferase-like glycosyltransferase
VPRRVEVALVLVVVALGLFLRVEDLGRACFAHPENYAPGWDDPSWVTAPPARRSTLPDVLRANLADGHPPLWFVAMLPWVKTFGTSLEALRLPSALTGALCVLLVWRLARREGGALAGLLAALLLALHGPHVFWSRMARMYAPACLLALLATLFLVRLLDRGRRRDALGYVAAAGALLWTQAYGFPIVAAHGLWAAAQALRSGTVRRDVLAAVGAAVVVGAPILTLAVYQNPPTKWADPAVEHFDLGFAFFSAANFFGPRPSTALSAAGIGYVATAAALLSALFLRGRRPDEASSPPPSAPVGTFPTPVVWLLAVAATGLQGAFVWRFGGRSAGPARLLFGTCAVPALVAAGLPVVARLLRAAGGSGVARLAAAPFLSPTFVLAVVPWALMALVSVRRPSFVARGAVLFAPFLLAAVAVGATALLHAGGRWRRSVGVGVLLAAVAVAGASTAYWRESQASPRDYRGLAAKLLPVLAPDDLVLVQGGYADPPLLYYLASVGARVVPRGGAAELFPDVGRRRVWAVVYDDDAFPEPAFRALGPRETGRRVEAYRAAAIELAPR